MNQAIIAAGSNIEPDKNIARVREILAKNFGVVAETDFVSTKPVGYTQQPDFLNGAVLIRTDLKLEPLRQHLKKIEDTLGRRRTILKFGPRTVDLDIVVWNGKLLAPDFYERDYLKKAVLELMPNLKY
ncbi:MAG: 2-amino-4-hydroxy-6-hydroxymethyldihydropteridine diphosphokinase [Candidatus Omnitrophica bacterium]|nr:2-amino-4-hydroxy-6-hydroxymethyldihydropteridine diphosphokinase [Candidatus Omnitrophota bacterium]